MPPDTKTRPLPPVRPSASHETPPPLVTDLRAMWGKRRPKSRRNPAVNRLKLPKSPPKRRGPQTFDFSLLSTPIETTASRLRSNAVEFEAAKKGATGVEDREKLVDLALRGLALARLVDATSDGKVVGPADPVAEAHCRASEAYLLTGHTTQSMKHAFEGLGRARKAGVEPGWRIPLTMGRGFMKAGNLAKAHGMFKDAQRLVRLQLGDDDIQQCEVLCEMAENFWRNNRRNESINTLCEVWSLQEAKFGADAPELIPTYLLLGQAYTKKGETERAKEQLERAIRIADAAGSTQTCGYAQALVLLGTCYSVGHDDGKDAESERELLKSLEHLKRASKIYEDLLGENCKEAVDAHRDMATTLVALERFGDSVQCMQKVLAGMTERFGPYSYEVAITWKRLGEMLALDEKTSEARMHLKKSVQTFSALSTTKYAHLINSIKSTLYRLQDASGASEWLHSVQSPTSADAKGSPKAADMKSPPAAATATSGGSDGPAAKNGTSERKKQGEKKGKGKTKSEPSPHADNRHHSEKDLQFEVNLEDSDEDGAGGGGLSKNSGDEGGDGEYDGDW